MRKKANVTRIICLVLLLCTSLSFFAGCAKGNKIVADDGKYLDKKTDVSYISAPLSYEPIAKGEEIYGHMGDINFYEIVGQDPLEWVCEEYGTVFYASDIELPTPDKLDIEYANICTESTSSVTRAKIESSEDISAIINEYLAAESIYYPGLVSELSYKIKFADTSRGIYYSFLFVRYSEDYEFDGVNYGKDFIYNRFEGRFVPAPAELVKYINEI